jgi:ATP-dependent protease Clp ATPase subunit
MLDIMYDIPSRASTAVGGGIKEVVVNEDVIGKHESPIVVYQKPEAELA